MDSEVKSQVPAAYTFGEFEFSLATQELRRGGEVTRLQMQPAKALNVLLSRAGEIVSREELRKEVWSDGIHVDFDDALNHSIKYLRDALGDDAAMPRYIETIPRRGYRFIARLNAAPPTAVKASPVRATGSSNRAMWPGMIAAVVVIPVILVGWKISRPSLPTVKNVRQLTHFGRATSVVTDGTRMFVEEEQGGRHTIAVLPGDGSADPVPVQTPFPNTGLLDISPDGKELLIAGYGTDGSPAALFRMPAAGGAPQRVGEISTTSAKWSADGRFIAFAGHAGTDKDGVYVADASGTVIRKLADGYAQVDAWSNDGRSLRYTVMNQATGGMAMWEVQAQGGEPHPLFSARRNANARWGEGQCCGFWSKTGKQFYFREGSSHKIAILAETNGFWPLSGSGPNEMYAATIDIDNYTVPAITPDGRRIFFVGRSQAQELLRFDGTRNEFVPYLEEVSPSFVSWSPNGREIAYSAPPDLILWRSKPDGSDRVQLVSQPMQVYGPVWSPDGKQIAFHTLLPGKPGKIGLIPADGGKPEILFSGESTGEDAQNWSPDGKTLLFGRTTLDESGATTAQSIWTLDMAKRTALLLHGSEGMGSPVWSPDGKYIATVGDDGRKMMLLDVRSQKWSQIASGVSLQPPRWTHDGSAIIFQDSKVSESQPVYRLTMATRRVQEIASRKQILRGDVARYQIIGLTPQDDPIARVIRNSADIYELDLEPQ